MTDIILNEVRKGERYRECGLNAYLFRHGFSCARVHILKQAALFLFTIPLDHSVVQNHVEKLWRLLVGWQAGTLLLGPETIQHNSFTLYLPHLDTLTALSLIFLEVQFRASIFLHMHHIVTINRNQAFAHL